ncbi:MAG: BTAD domain-containing putative transcriptional regulator [Caldilineaceae bacterium]
MLGDNPPMHLGSRKAQALFCYLAVTAKPVARASLTVLLWSEMAEQAAKNNLRTTLTMLKQQLGPYIEATTSAVTFNRELPYQLDVEKLYLCLDAALAARNVADLQAAVKLYQGEFLQGFQLRGADPFEEWVLQQREQLHLRMLHALETLMTLCIEQNEYSIGLAAGRKVLELEPWSEVAHRQLMILLAASGQRTSALAQYERCRQILVAELGIEPAPETTLLYQQLQTGTFMGTDGQKALASPATATAPLATGKPPSSPVIPNNLIAPLAKFIGRQEELAFLHARITTTDCRLLTIFGPGGMGKTALAQALARRLVVAPEPIFPDGIFFVALANVESKEQGEGNHAAPMHAIITTIAEAIGCQLDGKQPAAAQLQSYLRPRRLLLILDNFEQLVNYATVIVTLLTNAPGLTMLITSRVRLNIRGEATLALRGLSLAATDDGATFQAAANQPGSEAIALFVHRAQSLKPDFRLDAETFGPVVAICRLVGGLPLAIEMTAAWLTLFSCAEIAEKLKQDGQDGRDMEWLRSPFLDQAERHRTLQRVFADSWVLLPAAAQWTLARLSIFTGSFTRQAAQAVTNSTLADLAHLHDHSMLQIVVDGDYSLHPLLKQFAARQWLALTAAQPQQRALLEAAHSRYYLQALAALTTTVQGAAVVAAIQRLQQSHAEIVRGWQWAVQHKERAQLQQSMAGLLRYLELTNQAMVGKALFGLAAPTATDPTTLWLQVAQCHFMRRLAEHDQARKRLEELVVRLRAMVGAHSVDPDLVDVETFALRVLGWVYYEQGEYEAAQRCFATVYARATAAADQVQLTQALNGLGSVAFSTKHYPEARQHYQAALTHAQQHADLHYTAIILGNLAAIAQATHAYAEAETYLQARLQLDEQTQNVRQMAVSNQRLGQLALAHQMDRKAEAYFRDSLAHFTQLGNSPEIAHVMLDLSRSLLQQNQLPQAEEQCLQSLQLAIQAQMSPRMLAALTLLAEIRLAQAQYEAAATLLQMVTRHGPLSANTEKIAEKLQVTVTAALGEAAITRINQEIANQSLQEFSLHLLTQPHVSVSRLPSPVSPLPSLVSSL